MNTRHIAERFLRSFNLFLITAAISLPLLGTSINFVAPFSTERQSIWGSGPAFVYDYNKTFGASWDKSTSIGGFTTGLFGELYGARGDFSTSGSASVTLGARISSGDLSVGYPVLGSLSYTDNVRQGSPFSITSSYSVDSSAQMRTTFPTVQAWLDAGLAVNASIGGKLCAGAFGCTPDGRVPLGFSVSPELFGFNRGGDGKLRVLGRELPFGPGVPIDLRGFGELTLNIPNLPTASGGPALDGSLRSMGSTEVIRLTADIDGIVTTVFGVPALEGEIGILPGGVLGASYNLIDVETGPSLSIDQDFLFSATPMLSLLASQAINWGGSFGISDRITVPLGTPLSPIFPAGASLLTITPQLNLAAMLQANTELGIGIALEFLVLSGSLDYDFYVTDGSFEFGPVYSFDEVFRLLDFSIFSNRFAVGGFSPYSLDPFTIQAEIPEPGTLLLLGSALAYLLFRRHLAARS